MHEAMFYKKARGFVQCRLCPRNCKIFEGSVGFCRVRQNIGGKLYSLVFGKPCSLAVDPIEKKPLFHFAIGSQCFSIATVGCNFSCAFCQNFDISQPKPRPKSDGSPVIFGQNAPPEKVIAINKTPGFAWTYTEPTVFYEYFYETALLCRKMQKKSGKKFYHVWVSNGYTNPAPIRKAVKLMHAINVDYKGNADVYKKLCGVALLEKVQTALLAYKKANIWIEITNLLITNHSDSPEQIKEMCEWVYDNVGNVPMHFSRYFPMNRMTDPATPIATLEKAAKIADEFFDFVYIGNVQSERQHTYCPNCKTLLIRRSAFSVAEFNAVRKGKTYRCPSCTKKLLLKGMEWSPFGHRENNLLKTSF